MGAMTKRLRWRRARGGSAAPPKACHALSFAQLALCGVTTNINASHVDVPLQWENTHCESRGTGQEASTHINVHRQYTSRPCHREGQPLVRCSAPHTRWP